MNEEIEKLHRILGDVKPEECFWINNGPIVRNIYELINVLQTIDDRTFSYHVNKERNDFSVWVRAVLGDEELADKLLKTKNRKRMLNIIRERVRCIEGMIDSALEKEKINHLANNKEVIHREFSFERVFLELIISFLLGIVVGVVVGMLLEHYSLIPVGWF